MGDCSWWFGVDKCFLDDGHQGDHETKWATDLVTVVFRTGDPGVRRWPSVVAHG